MTTKAKPVKDMSFEEALAELETIVRQLEQGEVELEKSIAIYERGAELKKHCDARLKAAELKVEQIVQSSDGTPKTEPASLS
jgi:exodeoxyribonuclease VII small subunit